MFIYGRDLVFYGVPFVYIPVVLWMKLKIANVTQFPAHTGIYMGIDRSTGWMFLYGNAYPSDLS